MTKVVTEEQEKAELIDHAIVMGQALNRLQSNPDFQAVIMNGYLKEKVLASVSMLAVPQVKQRGERPDIMEDLVASSNLKFYFKMIEDRYTGAIDPVLSDEEQAELDAIEAEGEA